MAMASAKPIIVSDLPGMRMLVQNKVNGFRVIPNDVNDLTDKIKFLISNKSLGQEWGRYNRETVENKYSWEVVSRQLNNLYQEVVRK
jgi:glycosyltransferase involved in cell wall biosynthesis